VPKADRISPGGVKLLKEKQLAHFATAMADGAPQLTPVWVDVSDDGTLIYINTAEGRIKTRNFDRNPKVALEVVDRENDYRFVSVRGRVVERTHEGAREHIDKLAKKYLGQDTYPWMQPGMQRVKLAIKPEFVLERGTEEKA
jgi:PPOX class probable F420-dependent enzyme